MWKAFCDEWDPKEKGRCAAMLTSILNTRFSAEVWQEIETWETRIQKYEELSEEKVSENIRRSVVTNNCDHEKIHDHLTLNASRLSKWADLKKEIREFTMAGKRWGQDDAMDVDALRGMDRKMGYTPLWRALNDFP